MGKWIWNKTESRKDPKTGRRRRFPKPESEWYICKDEKLRIIPHGLWNKTQKRLEETRRIWPVGKGKTGFKGQKGSRVKQLSADLSVLKSSCDRIFKTPPIEWIEERGTTLQEILERRVGKSSLILRDLLGKIHLEPVQPDIGKPYLRAVSKLQTLALLETNPHSLSKEPGISYESNNGSNALRWWTLSQRIRTPRDLCATYIKSTELPGDLLHPSG